MSGALCNIGTAALPITNIAVAGLNLFQFSQSNNCGASVPAGASCAIDVIFRPTTSGRKSAKLTVNGDGDTGGKAAELTGTGVAPTYTLHPASLAFGGEQLNSATVSQTLTLTNTGSTPLAITKISLSGANPMQFSYTNNCGPSVAAGDSCTIDVCFNPTAPGSKSANLTVTAGGGAAAQSAILTGTGIKQS
jgi:hypothetical protein